MEQKQEYNLSIRQESAKLLADFCKKKNIEKVLEIGTNKGSSAILMLNANNNIVLTTVEKDEACFEKAKQNLKKQGLESRVNQVLDDAKSFVENLKDKYDLIFLDGPKGQYIKYLPYLLKALNTNGYLIADNVHFHGKVLQEGHIPHKHRTIVVNLRKFLFEIENAQNLKTKVYDIDDGISVSQKIDD